MSTPHAFLEQYLTERIRNGLVVAGSPGTRTLGKGTKKQIIKNTMANRTSFANQTYSSVSSNTLESIDVLSPVLVSRTNSGALDRRSSTEVDPRPTNEPHTLQQQTTKKNPRPPVTSTITIQNQNTSIEASTPLLTSNREEPDSVNKRRLPARAPPPPPTRTYPVQPPVAFLNPQTR